MSDHGKTGGAPQAPATADKGDAAQAAEKPDWANGLKQIYDSVVEEPLPDELAELLARFDDDEA